LFKEAGLKPADLRDPDNAKIILNIISGVLVSETNRMFLSPSLFSLRFFEDRFFLFETLEFHI
jgi:hypothetical protein